MDTRWWIKADGCDVVKGLFESTKGVWSGDVDLNNGCLQHLYRDFQLRIKFIEGIGIGEKAERSVLRSDLNITVKNIGDDLELCLKSKTYNNYRYCSMVSTF